MGFTRHLEIATNRRFGTYPATRNCASPKGHEVADNQTSKGWHRRQTISKNSGICKFFRNFLYHLIYERKRADRTALVISRCRERAATIHRRAADRKTDRKRFCVAYSREMVGPRGQAFVVVDVWPRISPLTLPAET